MAVRTAVNQIHRVPGTYAEQPAAPIQAVVALLLIQTGGAYACVLVRLKELGILLLPEQWAPDLLGGSVPKQCGGVRFVRVLWLYQSETIRKSMEGQSIELLFL
jgi:hypothetical protein